MVLLWFHYGFNMEKRLKTTMFSKDNYATPPFVTGKTGKLMEVFYGFTKVSYGFCFRDDKK